MGQKRLGCSANPKEQKATKGGAKKRMGQTDRTCTRDAARSGAGKRKRRKKKRGEKGRTAQRREVALRSSLDVTGGEKYPEGEIPGGRACTHMCTPREFADDGGSERKPAGSEWQREEKRAPTTGGLVLPSDR